MLGSILAVGTWLIIVVTLWDIVVGIEKKIRHEEAQEEPPLRDNDIDGAMSASYLLYDMYDMTRRIYGFTVGERYMFAGVECTLENIDRGIGRVTIRIIRSDFRHYIDIASVQEYLKPIKKSKILLRRKS